MPETVGIAVSTYKSIPSIFLQHFMELFNRTLQDFTVKVAITDDCYIGKSRCCNVERLINDCDWIFFLDADQIVPNDAIFRLMKHDKDIVSALYFKRYPPHFPLMYKQIDDKFHEIVEFQTGKLMEVDAVGAGSLLVKIGVFKKMEHPWFLQERGVGEDIYFCKKARKLGYKIYCDTGLISRHLGWSVGIENFEWQKFVLEEEMKGLDKENKIL